MLECGALRLYVLKRSTISKTFKTKSSRFQTKSAEDTLRHAVSTNNISRTVQRFSWQIAPVKMSINVSVVVESFVHLIVEHFLSRSLVTTEDFVLIKLVMS